jgi:hypothetical protein
VRPGGVFPAEYNKAFQKIIVHFTSLSKRKACMRCRLFRSDIIA